MAHDVFISYATPDKTIAEAVCTALEAKGIQCWIALRDVPVGTKWAEKIVDALNESRALVLVLSSASNNSGQVIREVERAASRDIPLVALRVEDVRLSKSLELFISSHQWLDAQTPPIEGHIERLARNIELLLATEGQKTGARRTGESEIRSPATAPPLKSTGAPAYDNQISEVRHPWGTEMGRGPMKRCSFSIKPGYKSGPNEKRWRELADVEVEIVGEHFPGNPNTYLIPSGVVPAELAHSELLRQSKKRLERKRRITEAFVQAKKGQRLEGAWFMHKGFPHVYSAEYDAFINSSI